MGNYLGKKNKNPNLIDESADQPNVQQFDVSRCKKPTVYRPQIFIDYYKSKLFKVNSALEILMKIWFHAFQLILSLSRLKFYVVLG